MNPKPPPPDKPVRCQSLNLDVDWVLWLYYRDDRYQPLSEGAIVWKLLQDGHLDE